MKHTLSARQLSSPNETVDAVVAVLIHDSMDSDLEILLIHRANRIDDPWSGQIGLPGGRVEKSDPSTRSALRREVREEVGFHLETEAEEIGRLSISSPMRRLDFKVQPWVYGLVRRPDVTIGPEVQSSFWVSLTKLPTLRRSTEVDIGGTRRTVDAFLVDGRVVWGFTHRVLNELLAVQELTAN
jgi:8-oxo-dGTP pyrophosphatase MutT (NUDIX family)